MRSLAIFICVNLLQHLAVAQIGGRSGFEFINVPADTRLAAQGGLNVSLSDWDVNMFFSNPASLNKSMFGNLAFNHTFYYGGVHLNRLAYSHEFEKTGIWGFGVQHINYGSIDGYDPSGNYIGDYQANDIALVAGNAQQSGNFRFGANIKWVYSNLVGYNASALLFDVGGMFIHPSTDFNVGLTIKNVGFRLFDYTASSNTRLPFDVQLGASLKPEHMPVRFSVTAYHLDTWDILYYDEENNVGREKPGTFEIIFSHLNFGAEFLVSKNVHLRGGYNYLVRQDLKLPNKSGASGLSFGLLIRIKAFDFSYSRAMYHAAGGINYIGLTSNISKFYKKKEVIN